MPRKIESCPRAPRGAAPWKDYEKLTCTVKVVTPLFGGGVEAGAPDPVTLIRPSSIRGHLRFWWRATRGAHARDAESLSKREVEIWGSTENPSPVQVTVELVEPGKRVPCAKYVWDKNARGGNGAHRLRWEDRFRNTRLAYALFPFQGQPPKEKDNPDAAPEVYPAEMATDVCFRLIIRYPGSCEQDVRAALTAWLNFGGLGARTRRGCGSLYCAEFAPPRGDVDGLKQWLTATLPSLAGQPPNIEWPVLAKKVLVGGNATDALGAWARAIDVLQRFRQGVNVGRNPGRTPSRPGRSCWPEPETVRKVTGRRHGKHRPIAGQPQGTPRAALGLPIVFHFKDHHDPPDTELDPVFSGEPAKRMASPLILKPLAIAGGRAVPLILCLWTPKLEGAELREIEGGPLWSFQRDDIVDAKFGKYPNSPMAGHADAVEAFLAFAKDKKGFEEVL